MRTEISSVGELPELHLMGHTCTNLNGDLIFVWGGYNDNLPLTLSRNSDLWIYETLTGYWRRKVCTGECPPYLSSCSSCLIGQKMYIFGGHSALQDNWLNCLYCLDLDTFIWRDIGSQARAFPTKPIRSDKNVCWSYHKKLYVFGGYGWSQVEHYSELLDCQKDLQLTPDFRWPIFGWNNQLVEYDPADRTWRWPSYTGKCPSARAAHSGALMGDKYFIFGGRDSHERLNDLYTLDMKTMHWQQIAVLIVPTSSLNTTFALGHRTQDDHSDAEYRIEGEAEDQALPSDGEDHLDSLAAENHRQLVEEMHDVQVDDDDERWNLAPSSSSLILSAGIQELESNISNETGGRDQYVQQADQDDNFEYPHPSHLLQRWSLSSSVNQTSQTSEEDTRLMDDLECLFETQQQTGEGRANASSLSTTSHHAQNLMPLGGTQESNDATHAASDQNQSDQHHQNHYQDPTDQQQHHHHFHHAQDVRGEDPRPGEPEQMAAGGGGGEVQPLSDGADDTVSARQQRLLIPTGRSFCSLTPISNCEMLLFGGVDSHDRNLDDCWVYNILTNQWTQINDFKHKRSRLRHTGARTKQNEVVIMGGSSSDKKIDEFCSDVFVISFEAKSLKRLALDAVSRSVRMKTIQKTKGLPSTLIKLIKLRKQAMALTMRRSAAS